MGTVGDLIKAGYVRSIGLSEVGPDTIRRAQAVHPIVDLQIEYAIITRKPESKIFPTLRELGIGVTAYGVLSRGLLGRSMPATKGDFRAWLPRFAGNNGEKNQKVIERLQSLAQERSLSIVQLCIAWVLAKGTHIVPLVGARTRKQLQESLGALQVTLSPGDLIQIEQAVPESAISGTRYDERQMQMLDSER